MDTVTVVARPISTDAPRQAAMGDVKLPAPLGKKTKERKYPTEKKSTGENEPVSDLLSIETTAPNEPSSADGKDRNPKKAEAYVNPERVRTGGAQRVS